MNKGVYKSDNFCYICNCVLYMHLGACMMDKNYVRYLKESTRKIQARIAGGNWQFGDHRRLKEQLAELAKYSK